MFTYVYVNIHIGGLYICGKQPVCVFLACNIFNVLSKQIRTTCDPVSIREPNSLNHHVEHSPRLT
jgi:hypothetical protein